jgi:Ca-activated chloride channel family protein
VSFGHPLLLLTLLVIPAAVAVYLLAGRRRMRYAVRFTNLEVLAGVAPRHAWRRWVPPAVFLLMLASLSVALARPHVKTLVPKERATVILVIDASGSMQARDVHPTRLAAAQDAARRFVDLVPKQLRVGLVVFAGEPQIGSPPTVDHDIVRESINEIGEFSGLGGTAIGDALAAAVDLGEQAVGDGGSTIALRTAAPSPRARGLVSILFLSDGAQRRGYLQPLEGAARAKAAGIPVYTVALGTPNGTVNFGGYQGFGGQAIPVPPDPATLRMIAQTTGGKFYEARSAKALRAAYETLGSRLGRTPGHSEVTYLFLAVAAALLIAAGLLSALWSPRLP